MILCSFVEAARVRVEKYGHLVDESSRASGAGTVHPLFNG